MVCWERDVIAEEHPPLLPTLPVFWDNIKAILNKCCTQTTFFFFKCKQVWQKERKLHGVIRMRQIFSGDTMSFIRLTVILGKNRLSYGHACPSSRLNLIKDIASPNKPWLFLSLYHHSYLNTTVSIMNSYACG